MSRDEYFLEGPTNQNSNFIRADGFHNFWLSFCKGIQFKVLLASMKPPTKCENTSSNPLQGACSDFPIAACECKSCSKAACDPKIVSKAGNG